MSRRQVKNDILALLRGNNWLDISKKLHQYHVKDVIPALFSALCQTEELCKWHAVSGFGQIVPQISIKDREAGRVIMRRFLWSLNDESGGIGWGAPESIAEIMAADENIFSEYIHMLFSYMEDDGPELFQNGNFLELPALQQGVLWGVGRLLQVRNSEMLEREADMYIRHYLKSTDQIVAGLAVWCLGMCQKRELITDLLPFRANNTIFNLYQNHSLHQISVAEITRDSIRQLEMSTM